MHTSPLRPLFTARDLAVVLNVSQRTVRRLAAKGDAPQPIRVGRVLRWPEAAVQDWIARQQEGPRP